MNNPERLGKSLQGKRILVCGKGGSGKSTIIALLAAALEERAYEVVVLDGDASNPEGLIRLLFGKGVEGEPKPLVEFFGGLGAVTCPVDDPEPLRRLGDSRAVPENRIDLFREVPPEYYLRKGGITLLQAGKIENYGQGCDGPLEKVVRDFLIQGDAVNLIDMKAGIEHFGRRIPDRMDIVLGLLDCTLESVSISKRMADFCGQAGISDYWLILNKVGSLEMEDLLREKLGDLGKRVIAAIPYEQKLIKDGLSGKALGDCMALDNLGLVVERLERLASEHRDASRADETAPLGVPGMQGGEARA
jgi:CO dehydrogenase maturation factor